MKILHITNNYRPYSGGVVSSIDSFVSMQKKMGHEVEILTFNFNGSEDMPATTRIDGLCFRYKNNEMIIPYKMKSDIENTIKIFKPDIIHMHHPFYICTAAQKINEKYKIPTVFTHHSLYEQYLHYVPIIPGNIKKKFLNKSLKKFCNSVDHVIAPGNKVLEIVNGYKSFADSTILPSPILDYHLFEPNIHNLNSPIKIISVSRLAPEKNIFFLIDLLAELDINYEFTLIGYGYLKEEILDYAHNRSVRINLKDNLNKTQIAQELRINDIFIYASQSETQGLVIAEALAAGRPVVALNGPGVEDAIENNINGYLVDNKTEFLQKIKYLYNNSDVFLKMQQKAYESSKRYHPENLTHKLLEIYKQVIKKSVNRVV